MKVLSLSTAEQGASLAVFGQGRLICEDYWTSRLTHSKRLIPMVEDILGKRAGIRLNQVDGFVAAKGPGSFTGLRIGISVVKGFAYALDKPCVGVSTLDGIGWRFAYSDLPVCVMMDARRGEVYTSVFRFSRGELLQKDPERVCSPEQAVHWAGQGAVLFAGSGSKAYQDMIQDVSGERAVFSPESMDHISAAALARPALDDDKFFNRPENSLIPSYIRKSDAEINFGENTSILT